LAQTAPVALGTNFYFVNLNVIGIFDSLQGLPRMTGLPPGFSTTGRAQVLRAGFAQTIAGRGLIAVSAVLGYLGLQFLDPLLQLLQSLLQNQNNLHQRFGLAMGQW